MKTMTIAQMRERLDELIASGVDENMEVMARVANDDSLTWVGGVWAMSVDSGCTEVDMLVIEADVNAESEYTVDRVGVDQSDDEVPA